MAYVMGSSGLTNDQARAELCYWQQTSTNTTITYRFQIYIHGNGAYTTNGALSTSLSCSGQTTHTTSGGSASVSSGTRAMLAGNYDYTFSKTTSTQTKTVYFSVTSTGSTIHGTSSGSVSLSIPTLTKYTIKYSANGYGTAPSSQTKYYGKTLTLRSAISATGYTFKGWNTSSAGTGTNYAAGASYTKNESDTLYAKWVANTYTVTLNANGGTSGSGGSTVSRTYGENVTIAANRIPSRNGYNFLGWATSSTATAATYTHAGITSGTCTISAWKSTTGAKTLYAVWKAISYNITYNLNEGSVSSANPSSYNITTSTFTLNNPIKQYFNFLGWTGTDLTESTQVVSIPQGSTGNRSYTANWERAYIPPAIEIISSKRVNNNHVDDDSGTVAAITFTWANGDDAGTTVTPDKYNVVLTNIDDNTTITLSGQTLTGSPVTAYVGGTGENVVSTEAEYTVEVTIFKNNTSYSASATDYISKAYFIIDINATGTAIGFGGPTDNNQPGFYCYMDAYFNKTIVPAYIPGLIQMYGGVCTQEVINNKIVSANTNIPSGWLLCDGSILLIDDYPELAAVLGSTYGGNGTTTFGLPDFRGRTGVGVGTGTSSTATEHTLGQTAGSERVTLTKTQIPEFEGSMYVRGYKTSSTSQRAALAHGATGIIDIGAIGSNTANGIMATGVADLGSNPVTISFGGGESHNNMQPYIGINYIIATGKTS